MHDPKMKPEITVRARVRLTVEVLSNAPWDPTCALSQIFSQAGREATEELQRLTQTKGFRIVGEPKVEAVIVAKED